MQSYTHKTTQPYLVCLGLLAILMLTIGPVTSQFIAWTSSPSPTTQTHQAQITNHSEHHQLDNNKQQTKLISTSHDSHHKMNLCGYCDLLHNPILLSYILVILHPPTIHQPLTPHYINDIYITLYNNPQSRAPPPLA